MLWVHGPPGRRGAGAAVAIVSVLAGGGGSRDDLLFRVRGR